MRARRHGSTVAWALCLLMAGSLVLPAVSSAATAAEIDAATNAALARFQTQVKGANQVLAAAKGVLVFANVIQAGLGVGGQYGQGALRIRGKTTGYYSIASGSFGFQFGAQKKDIIIVFFQQQALQNFESKNKFNVGVDGSIVVATLGAGGSVNTATLNQPVVAFVVGRAGLMYNLTLQGTKITRIHPS